MLLKLLYFLNTTFQVPIEEYEKGLAQLSKLNTIFAIALITILSLLTLSLYKVSKLATENKKLKKQLNS